MNFLNKLVLLYIYPIFSLLHLTKAANEDFSLRIIHINDFHSRYDEINTSATKCKPEIGEKCIGGYARTVAAVKMLQQSSTNSIFLNAGDNFQGTLWYDKLKGNVTSYLMNLHPADAMTLGNHEFDDGIDGVVPYLTNIASPIVVCNIDDTDVPKLHGLHKKSVILPRGSKKIAVIGVIIEDTPNLSRPENLIFLDEIQSIREEIEVVTKQGADIIIILSHCGLTIDRKIAAEIGDKIHVIVGGHSHSLLYTGNPPSEDKVVDVYPVEINHPNGMKTLIVQALAFSKFVGNLTVNFNNDTNHIVSYEGNPIYMDDKIPQDPDILKELKPFQDIINEIGQEVVGSTLISLEKDVCSFGECSYGNLINDAYVDYYVTTNKNKTSWTFAPIALSNSGIIRVGLNKGNITFDDLATSHPYENTVDTFEIRGDYLLEALEVSASNYGTINLLQLSGLRMTIDIRAPKGSRVIDIKVRCGNCSIPVYENLDFKKYYRISIASWIGDGGNGYDVFKRHRRNLLRGPTSLSVVEMYLKKVSPVINRLDQRIKVIT
uniref:apyrase n=1 Tax=Culicoides sonorensis TaxID=179676 RepID=A0A336N6I4_CULSO